MSAKNDTKEEDDFSIQSVKEEISALNDIIYCIFLISIYTGGAAIQH